MTYEEIQDRIDEENDERREEAQKTFTSETGAELQTRCRELTVETANRYDDIMKGDAPQAFGAYDCDDIARILNTKATFDFDGFDLDMTPRTYEVDDWMDGAIETTLTAEADEAWDRSAFVGAYEKYLYTAAAFAKSMGATHAMRLYLRSWGIVRKTQGPCYRYSLDADDSLRAVNLERIASSKLWIEVEAAKLPKFKPQKKKTVASAGKTSNKRKGRG